MRIMTQNTRPIAMAPNSYSFLGDGKRIMASTLTWLMRPKVQGPGASSRRTPQPATGFDECGHSQDI